MVLAKAKQLIKNSTLSAAYRAGVLHSLVRRRLRRRAVVLMYHRVLPASLRAESFSADGIVVTPETFRRHMQLLSSRFQPVSAAQLAAALRNEEPLPERACLVTFDDGWWDNLEYALPILEEFRVPALIFLATDFIGTSRTFWQEHLSRMLFVASHEAHGLAGLLDSLGISLLTGSGVADHRLRIRAFVTALKNKPAAEIRSLVQEVEMRCNEAGLDCSPASVDRFLSWSEVARLAASDLITIGSHCQSHTPLPKLAHDEVARELRCSREILTSHLGKPPEDLAYPNGDFTPAIAAQAQAAGYRVAYTTERGHVEPGHHLWSLPRMNIHEGSASTESAFLARVAGLL